MSRLACIIPVLGTTAGLETTLVSVLEHRPDDCDVVVVHNVPYDDPYELSGEVQFLEAPRRAGLVQCLNLGIGATRAPIVHTLASGFEVAEGWIERARSYFSDPRVAAVSPVIYSAANRSQPLAAGVRYCRGGSKTIVRQVAATVDSQPGIDGPLLEAAFIRRQALTAFGGALPTAVGDGFADVDLALTLRGAGWQFRFEPRCQIFAPDVVQSHGKGFTAARHAERMFWRHWGETGRIVGLVQHPIQVAGSIVSSGWTVPLTALGRFIGLCELGAARSYRQTLAAAQADAEQAAAEWQLRHNAMKQADAARGQSLRIDKPHPIGRRADAEQSVSSNRHTAIRG